MNPDILIPVHNGESFIEDCVTSALQVAELLDTRVIVSANFCTDGTVAILSSFNNSHLKILMTETFLTAGENYLNCLRNSDSEYVISIGADDKLNVHGQAALFSYFSSAKTKPSVLFGYSDIIDAHDKIRRNHKYSDWKRLTSKRIIRNSFSGHNPNLNGAWIKRELINAFNNEFQPFLNKGAFIRVSDLYFWNYISFYLLHENNLSQGYIYVHTPTVFYREYFESYQHYRNPEIEKNANQGRVFFIYYCIKKLKIAPKEYLSDCRFGIKVYARNNFTNLFFAHGEQSVRALFKELEISKSLFLLERVWLYSSCNAILQRTLLFCLLTRKSWKSAIVSFLNR